jgi:hypothetical protein
MPERTLSVLLDELDSFDDQLKQQRLAHEAEAMAALGAAADEAKSKRRDAGGKPVSRNRKRHDTLQATTTIAEIEGSSPGRELTECLESYFKPSPEVKQGSFCDPTEGLASPIKLRPYQSQHSLGQKKQSNGPKLGISRSNRRSLGAASGDDDDLSRRSGNKGGSEQDTALQVEALARELALAQQERLHAKAEALSLRMDNIRAKRKIKQ